MASRSLEGSVAVIAGRGKNLGALIAKTLVDAGTRKLLLHYNSDSSRDATERTASALKESGADVLTYQGDLSHVEHATKLRYREGAFRQGDDRHQHGGARHQEADSRCHRKRLRPQLRGQCEGGVLLHSAGRAHDGQRRQYRDDRDVAARDIHAVLHRAASRRSSTSCARHRRNSVSAGFR